MLKPLCDLMLIVCLNPELGTFVPLVIKAISVLPAAGSAGNQTLLPLQAK